MNVWEGESRPEVRRRTRLHHQHPLAGGRWSVFKLPQADLVALFTVLVCTGACAPAERNGAAQGPPPRRIVSLSPATTELLFALGVGDRLVGRTRFDEDPPAARDVPSIGDGLQPNVEVVLATRPDLVVFYQAAANAPAIHRIEQTGVRVLALRIDGLDDLVHATHVLGQMLDVVDRADSLVADLSRQLHAVSRRGIPGPSAAILAWIEPPIVIGSSSFLSEILEHAGLVNVFHDIELASTPVSIEVITARKPDLLVLGESAAATVRGRPEWAAVRAVREGRVLVVTGSHFSHPSYRASAAIRELQALVRAAGF